MFGVSSAANAKERNLLSIFRTLTATPWFLFNLQPGEASYSNSLKRPTSIFDSTQAVSHVDDTASAFGGRNFLGGSNLLQAPLTLGRGMSLRVGSILGRLATNASVMCVSQ